MPTVRSASTLAPLAHTHIRNLAHTWLLCMRCGPLYEINMVRVIWLHPPPKMYFHVNALGASSRWWSRATRSPHFSSWDRTEANSSPKPSHTSSLPITNHGWGKGYLTRKPPGADHPASHPLFLARFPCFCWPSKPRVGRGPFGHTIATSQHLFICIYLLSLVTEELGQ